MNQNRAHHPRRRLAALSAAALLPGALLVGAGTIQAAAQTPAAYLYVANQDPDSVLEYAQGADGDAAPVATISGPQTGLAEPSALAVDAAGQVYVANSVGGPDRLGSITVYPAGASGDALPVRTIIGPSTGLDSPGGIVVDAAGNVFVANYSGGDDGTGSITEYAAGADGDATPVATISGPSTGLYYPDGMAMDAAGTLIVTNYASVTEYAKGADGDAVPTVTISGEHTGLADPYGAAVDSSGTLFVANEYGGTDSGAGSVTEYPAGADGDATPTVTIVGEHTGLSYPSGPAVDSAGNLYVADVIAMTQYGAGASGDATPTATISGAHTGIGTVYAVALRPSAAPEPVFTSSDSTSFVHGTPGTFTVSATPSDHARLCAFDGSIGTPLPAGFSFPVMCTGNPDGSGLTAGSSAQLTFDGSTPGGVYHFSFYAVDDRNLGANFNTNQAIQAFILTVDQAPILSGNGAPSFTVGQAGASYTYTASGYPDAPTIGLAAGQSLPDGLSLSAPVYSTTSTGDQLSTVTLSGTPAAGTGGTYALTLTASNGVAPDATESVQLTIYEAPRITSSDHTTFAVQRGNAFQVTTAGGYPTGPITFTESGALPPGVTFSAAGLLSGTPSASAVGDWPITITAGNGHASSSQRFVLSVGWPRVNLPARAPAGDGLIGGVNILTAAGGTVHWTGSGFAPHAPVTFAIYDAQTYRGRTVIATVDADAHGDVSYSGRVPNTTGIKYVVAGGYQRNGTVRYLTGQTRFMS